MPSRAIPELDLWNQCAPDPFTLEYILSNKVDFNSKGIEAIYALANSEHFFNSPKLLCLKCQTAMRALESNPDRVPQIIEALQEDKIRLARRVAILIEFLSDPELSELFFNHLDDGTATKILSYSYECSLNQMIKFLSHPPLAPQGLNSYSPHDSTGLFIPHEKDANLLSWAKCRERGDEIIDVHRTQILIMEILRQSDSSVNYFHGTLSSSLPGIIHAGGLVPLKKQQTLGIDNLAGEKRAGAAHNQYVLSAVGTTHPYTALLYAFVNHDLLPIDEIELEGALRLAHEHFPSLIALPSFIVNARLKSQMIERDDPYPLLIGITNTDGNLSPANLRWRGERHLETVPLDKMIFFVPEHKIEETKKRLLEVGIRRPVVSILKIYDYIIIGKRDDVELETAFRAIMGVIKSEASSRRVQ